MFTNLTLTDLIEAHNETKHPKIKRALLVLCNAVYKNKMGFPSAVVETIDPSLPNQTEVFIGKEIGKIKMIKAHRERTKMGLGESKTICENYFADKGLNFYYNDTQYRY